MLRDFQSPKASFPIHLLIIIHLDKGSLVPPMCTHGGSSFPWIIILFTQGHRVFRTPFQILVLRSGSSFLVPDPRSSFRILVPRSRSSFLVPDPRSSLQILVPRYGSSFLVPDPHSSFPILVSCSGSSFLVPDVTYRFITTSTKAAAFAFVVRH